MIPHLCEQDLGCEKHPALLDWMNFTCNQKLFNEQGSLNLISTKCGALPDLVAFVQFKKREKHPCRSVNFSKVAG